MCIHWCARELPAGLGHANAQKRRPFIPLVGNARAMLCPVFSSYLCFGPHRIISAFFRSLMWCAYILAGVGPLPAGTLAIQVYDCRVVCLPFRYSLWFRCFVCSCGRSVRPGLGLSHGFSHYFAPLHEFLVYLPGSWTRGMLFFAKNWHQYRTFRVDVHLSKPLGFNDKMFADASWCLFLQIWIWVQWRKPIVHAFNSVSQVHEMGT